MRYENGPFLKNSRPNLVNFPVLNKVTLCPLKLRAPWRFKNIFFDFPHFAKLVRFQKTVGQSNPATFSLLERVTLGP